MFEKLEKAEAELAKSTSRRDSLDEKIKKQTERRVAEWNAAILLVINASGVTPRELVTIMQQAGKLPADFGTEDTPDPTKEDSNET